MSSPSVPSVPSIPSKKQRKCGICGILGHNATTCKSEKVQNTVSETPAPAPAPAPAPTYVTLEEMQKMMNELRESLKPAASAIPPSSSSLPVPAPAPKVSYVAMAAAPPPAKPAVSEETSSVSSEETSDFSKPLMKTLGIILTRTAVKGAITEWILLKEAYATHPERFRTIGSGHTSEAEPDTHITFTYSHPGTRWNGSENEPVLFKTTYHITYFTNDMGKWVYKKMTAIHDLCGVKEQRTVAVFRGLA